LVSLRRTSVPATGLSLRSLRTATDLFPAAGILAPAAPALTFLSCPLGKHLGRPDGRPAGPLPLRRCHL